MKEKSDDNRYLAAVLEHERESLIRVASQLTACFDVEPKETDTAKIVSKQVKEKMKENHLQAWVEKPQHGYLMRTRKNVEDCRELATNAWLKKSTFSSHVEGYLCAVQEEEIFTNALKAKRLNEDPAKANCRLCKTNKESIQHIIAACPRLSVSMYLPWRHNKVANVVYQAIHPKADERTRQPITEVYSSNEVEIWWDTKIKTLTKLEHDRPDIVLWKRKESKCYIMDVCVCLDVNIDKNIKHKLDSYLPLAAELKRLYQEYDFDVLPIVIGATGLVTGKTIEVFKTLGVVDVEDTILRCQRCALTGTMKIVKSFMVM